VNLTIQDQATANAGSDEDRDHVAQPAARATPQLANCSHAHIVRKRHRNIAPGAQHLGDLDVLHAWNVCNVDDDAGRRVDDARHANADSNDILARNARVFDCLLHRLDQALDHHLRTGLGLRRLLGGGHDLACSVDDGGQNLGAP